ncbi:MAG: glycoside hydrolase family 3 N-terminal domain-containing protein [Bacillota bacterium]
MTLKEKIGQMYQTSAGFFNDSSTRNTGPDTGPTTEKDVNFDLRYNIGSVLNSMGADNSFNIQKDYLKHNRLGIPLMFMCDIIHGFRTIFPIPLGMACSWDPDLVEKSARIAAREGSVAGINVTFSPMVDLVRDARWGRVMESVGEDPLLNKDLAAAFVRGYQGSDLKNKETIAACVKHFAAYGAAEAGRDYNTVDMSEYRLRNYYLSGYKGGIDSQVAMVMTAFNTLNGIPATGNKFLFQDILRQEWGFSGVVISDWDAISELKHHTFARDGADAARKAIQAGVDIEMASEEYINHLQKLVLEGEVDEKLIDKAVQRILNLKYDLGLFADPFRYMDVEGEKKYHVCSQHRKWSRKTAAESIVLLKNDDVLPFNKQAATITVAGPYAESKKILGSWRARGDKDEAVSVKQGIKNKIGNQAELKVFSFQENVSGEKIEEIARQMNESEINILAFGEPQSWSGEASSRASLKLPQYQIDFAKQLITLLDKPDENLVLVLFNGRPLELKWFDEHIPAILEAWFPGTEGGNALADILFGDINPSGKLTMSFPYTVGQMPLYYNRYTTGRPQGYMEGEDKYYSHYIDVPNSALYPFGHGLSYTEFAYNNFSLNSSKLSAGELVKVRGEIENTGQYEGKETVQLYIKDCFGSRVRPGLELKDYQKVKLAPGEKKELKFVLDEDDLAYFHQGEVVAEEGEFKVFVGSSSTDLIDCGSIFYERN